MRVPYIAIAGTDYPFNMRVFPLLDAGYRRVFNRALEQSKTETPKHSKPLKNALASYCKILSPFNHAILFLRSRFLGFPTAIHANSNQLGD